MVTSESEDAYLKKYESASHQKSKYLGTFLDEHARANAA
jgi:hypothetical protein